jgi:hypothetical protein
MQSEQQLADSAEQDAIAKAKAEADAALMAINPSTSTSNSEQPQPGDTQTDSHPVGVNTADAMELCSTAELVELFAEYTAADVQQKEDDFFVSESHCSVDLDFNHPALDVSATTAPVSAGVLARAQLGDSNEDFDLNDMISRA